MTSPTPAPGVAESGVTHFMVVAVSRTGGNPALHRIVEFAAEIRTRENLMGVWPAFYAGMKDDEFRIWDDEYRKQVWEPHGLLDKLKSRQAGRSLYANEADAAVAFTQWARDCDARLEGGRTRIKIVGDAGGEEFAFLNHLLAGAAATLGNKSAESLVKLFGARRPVIDISTMLQLEGFAPPSVECVLDDGECPFVRITGMARAVCDLVSDYYPEI